MFIDQISRSRYRRTPTYLIEDETGRNILTGFRRTTILQTFPGTKVHAVVEGETFQDIALKYYHTPEMWYVLADANPQIFYPADLAVGDSVFVPPIQIAREL